MWEKEREKDIKNETSVGERKVGREIGVEEREPQRGRRRDRGETKIERET